MFDFAIAFFVVAIVSDRPPEELFEMKQAERKIVLPVKDIFREEMAAELRPEITTEPDGGFDGLNEEQHMAVTAPDKTVAVIAGPGTGKTKTLVSKIAYLIERLGVKPSEITAVTFTNKAAGEMRERLEKRLGGKRTVRGLTVGTFHADSLFRTRTHRPECVNRAVVVIFYLIKRGDINPLNFAYSF